MKRIGQFDRFWILSLVIFGALVAANYFPVLFGQVPFPKDIVLQFQPWAGFARSGEWQTTADIGDVVTSFYPYRAIAAQTITQGALPLWNPYMSSGAPFVANTQSALFYPLNFLFYVLPLPVAWSISIVLRMFLAAIFMAVFVRSIGASTTGAILSGILFASCGFMTGWQGQPMGDAAIWLPMICYALHRLHVRHSSSSLALASFAFAMPVLAGHPETAVHLTLAGSLLALFLWLWPDRDGGRIDWRFLLGFALAGLLALGLASVQILPTVEWLGQIGRNLTDVRSGLTRHDLLGLVSRDISRSPNSTLINMPEGAAYIGMITMLAASLAPFHKAKRYVVFLSVLAVLGLAAAYTIQPMGSIVASTPILRSLKNGRLILVGSFALSALAGLGISALEKEMERLSRHRRMAVLCLSAAFVFSWYMVYRLQRTTEFRVEFMSRPSFSRALLFLSVIPIGLKLYGALRGRFFPIAVCSLAAFDMVTFSYGYLGFAAPHEIFPQAPMFDFLAKNTDAARSRVIELLGPYPNNAPLMYGIASADGYEICLQNLSTFGRELVEQREDTISFVSSGILEAKDRRLDLLNVKYIVITPRGLDFEQFAADARFALVFYQGDVAVFENKFVLPRVFVVPASGIEVRPGVEDKLSRLKDASFDPRKSVVVSEFPNSLGSGRSESVAPIFSTETEILESGPNHLALRTHSFDRGILVVSQTFYPGWTATIDGVEAEVVSADIALTGIAVPAGTHDVQLRFRPMSLAIGAVLTFISLVIFGILMLARNRKAA